MYNKTIIEFGFYDIPNNQDLGKCNEPWLLIIPDITKTSSNYCLLQSTQAYQRGGGG